LRAGVPPWLPADDQALEALLRILLFEKAVYELRYELNNRPSWVHIPLGGVASLLGLPDDAAPQDRR